MCWHKMQLLFDMCNFYFIKLINFYKCFFNLNVVFRVFQWQIIQFFCMKIFYDNNKIQKYRRLIDFFCWRVVAYHHQRKNWMKIVNNQIIFLIITSFCIKSFKKEIVFCGKFLIVLTHNVSFFYTYVWWLLIWNDIKHLNIIISKKSCLNFLK